MTAIEFSVLFFGCMFLFLALGGLSGLLVYIFWGPGAISMLVLKSFGMTSSFEFIAVPLFVFMANMLERFGIAEDLYETMNRFVGGSAGGHLSLDHAVRPADDPGPGDLHRDTGDHPVSPRLVF